MEILDLKKQFFNFKQSSQQLRVAQEECRNSHLVTKDMINVFINEQLGESVVDKETGTKGVLKARTYTNGIIIDFFSYMKTKDKISSRYVLGKSFVMDYDFCNNNYKYSNKTFEEYLNQFEGLERNKSNINREEEYDR